ncbi:MAG TPA: molybdenum cofactor biosynthesis protein MoaE [Desulfobacteraceae bacterium]|nr:molybdenum cofactor biosynthesis protein MoaE [Desulfobacteraceae bacterium]
MDLNNMIQTLKGHVDYPKMGMIASHLGVVRETSLKGQKVSEIDVRFDKNAVDNIINIIKDMEGIIEVLIEVNNGRLKVGDEIMAVVVGGDTRDHVFPALITAVDRIKKEGSKKREFYKN